MDSVPRSTDLPVPTLRSREPAPPSTTASLANLSEPVSWLAATTVLPS